jgi:hypothetical protein
MLTSFSFKIYDVQVEGVVVPEVDVDVEYNPKTGNCYAIQVFNDYSWRTINFELTDVKVEEYDVEVIWDYYRQTPVHKQIKDYNPYAEGFEYIFDEVKDFLREKPQEAWVLMEE